MCSPVWAEMNEEPNKQRRRAYDTTVTCYGQQLSTGVPMAHLVFENDINLHYNDEIPNRATFSQVIFHLLEAIVAFRDSHRINGTLVYENTGPKRKSIRDTFGVNVLRAFCRSSSYVYSLLNDYCRVQYVQHYEEHNEYKQQFYCVRVLFEDYMGRPRAQRTAFADSIVDIMETRGDDWGVPLPPHFLGHSLGTRLQYYLKTEFLRNRSLNWNPMVHDAPSDIQQIEWWFDMFLYCYHHVFKLGREALPGHYDIPFYPDEKPGTGDDQPGLIIPAPPAPPQIDGHGGD